MAWFGAVQSQEYLGASWSLGLRMQSATDALIDQAFNSGAILRTQVMRPTWHFVAPADIRWLLALTAPRVEWKRELKRDKVIVNVTPFEPLSLAQKEAVEVAAQRYGDFLGLATTVLISE